ncbi:MAG: sulfur reduction protein DsrE [Syntrophobacteraceae bacterium CG2_30_61_12]|nr:MAG: sulfur reduction protein DsrE [Syntrophobacteraceae bacterium CG2_30_61_12]
MASFLFVLSREDNEAATRCFQMAKVAHSKGHQTRIFFIDGGVLWADSKRDLGVKTKTGDCPRDYLPYLVENQVYVGVCTPCANARQLDEARFFQNMALDGGPHLIEMAAESKVFNF